MKLVLCTLAVLVGSAVPASATATHVSIRSTFPLVVTGTGFDAHATVAVTVANGTRKLAKRVTTTTTGSFRAAWPATVHVQSCQSLSASAASAHHRATAAWKPAMDCGAIWAP